MKKLIFLILILFLLSPLTVQAYKVYGRDLTYIENEADYSNLTRFGIDKNGYSQSRSFLWKVDMYLPEETFIYAQPYAKMVFRIRNATAPFLVPEGAEFDGMQNYPAVGGYRTVSGVKDLDIDEYRPMWSVGGNSMASPPQQNTISINKGRWQKLTIHVPEKLVLKKIGDAERKKEVYKIDDHTYFFSHTELPAVVYYDPVLKSKIQKAIIIIFILSIIFLFTLTKFIPSFNIKSKHILITLILCFFIMFQLAQTVPNPQKTIVQFHSGTLKIDNDMNVFRIFTSYLINTVGLTKAGDYVIVGNNYVCNDKTYFLFSQGAENIFILKGYENYRCPKKILNDFNSSRVKIATVEEINDELSKANDIRHPFKKLFVLNAKIITFFSFILFSFLASYLILLAAEVKIKKIWKSAIIIFASYPIVMIFYTLVGYVARMPVSYHGNLPFDMTLTAYFMPGSIFGGNTIRMIFGALGVFILIFSRSFRKKINTGLLLLPLVLIILLFALPQTEFLMKREVVTVMSGEGFLYDQRVGNPFSIETMYTKMRRGNYEEIQKYLCTRDDFQDPIAQKIFFCNKLAGDTK
jgi:hypothetical protein